MSSFFWLKLYHEILDDPKMCRLSDRLYRRAIECFLLAGDLGKDGFLPDLEDAAWRLRLSPEALEADLVELAKTGIVQQREGTWHVTNYAKRQAAVPDAGRKKAQREREREALVTGGSYEPVTDLSRSVTQSKNKKQSKSKNKRESNSKTQNENTVTTLEMLGISPAAGHQFMIDYSPEYIAEKVAIFKWMKLHTKKSVQPGWLVRAIKENYRPPAEYQNSNHGCPECGEPAEICLHEFGERQRMRYLSAATTVSEDYPMGEPSSRKSHGS